MIAAALSSGRPRWWLKKLVGVALLVAATGSVLGASWRLFGGHPAISAALVGGLVAAAATALGALPVLFSSRLSERAQDALFGFGAGVMLAASAFSLVLPGLEAAKAAGASRWGAGLTVGAAVLLGGCALLLLDRWLPHEHFIKGVEGQVARRLQRVWLFVFAIALHNLPEGLAIGVGYAGTDAVSASALATGIALQDVPEGLVVAMALVSAGYQRLPAALIGAATGLVEPIGAVLGAAVVSYSAGLLPWGMGFAAGAMLFVVSHEIIPESHRKGHEAVATGGLLGGFVLMMLLDTSLG